MAKRLWCTCETIKTSHFGLLVCQLNQPLFSFVSKLIFINEIFNKNISFSLLMLICVFLSSACAISTHSRMWEKFLFFISFIGPRFWRIIRAACGRASKILLAIFNRRAAFNRKSFMTYLPAICVQAFALFPLASRNRENSRKFIFNLFPICSTAVICKPKAR